MHTGNSFQLLEAEEVLDGAGEGGGHVQERKGMCTLVSYQRSQTTVSTPSYLMRRIGIQWVVLLVAGPRASISCIHAQAVAITRRG